jgi:TonB family protein
MTKRQNDIERYLRGEMTAREMHALEKEALGDPFLSDALEGAQNSQADHFLFDLRELQSSVANRSGKRRPKMISMWNWSIGIAAGLLLVAVSGIYLIGNLSDKQKALSENIENIDASVLGNTGSYDTIEIVMPRVRPAIASVSEPARIERVTTGTVRHQAEIEVEANLTDPATIQIEREAEESASRTTSTTALSLNPRVISGTVTSTEDGSVLPGVNVVVKGTNIGTITDAEGKYEITLNQPDQKLEFSFIGVKSIEAEIRNKSHVNVALTPDYESLSEVVVTGKEIKHDEKKIFNLAAPEGGKDAYTKYLQQKLVYPEQALKNEVEGRVTIQFTVDNNGNLSNFKVINSLGYGCDDEAIRLIREGPAWSPSKKNDKAVTEEVKVGLKFDIPNKN